ncbi:ATP-dependent Clp protease adaptor ClpS [bacterium]|nr:ATP-dependent Clp protease adaptor ClpS [bacterium]
MTSKGKTKQRTIDWGKMEKQKIHFLILHNDDFNTFDHVITCLTSVCIHDAVQAEQCAYITHYKGKCDIKRGAFEELKLMKDQLTSKGLNVTIS